MTDDRETDLENLEAAAEVFEHLMDGTFYERQSAADKWLSGQPDDDITRRIVEGHYNGYILELAPRRR